MLRGLSPGREGGASRAKGQQLLQLRRNPPGAVGDDAPAARQRGPPPERGWPQGRAAGGLPVAAGGRIDSADRVRPGQSALGESILCESVNHRRLHQINSLRQASLSRARCLRREGTGPQNQWSGPNRHGWRSCPARALDGWRSCPARALGRGRTGGGAGRGGAAAERRQSGHRPARLGAGNGAAALMPGPGGAPPALRPSDPSHRPLGIIRVGPARPVLGLWLAGAGGPGALHRDGAASCARPAGAPPPGPDALPRTARLRPQCLESLPMLLSDLVRVHPGRPAALPTATGCDEELRARTAGVRLPQQGRSK